MKEIAYLFDLDGVIIDSETEYTKIWNLIDKKYPTGVDNFSLRIKGTNLDNILSTYYPDSEARAQVEKELYSLEAKMKYNYLPGAKSFLEKLKSRNIKMALVTSSNQKKMEHLYKDLPEISSFFNTIVNGDMVKQSKPDPEGYLLAASLLGVQPEDSIVVEDSLQGVIAGKKAGAKVCGILGTVDSNLLSPYCDIIKERIADIVIDNPFGHM